MGLQRQARLMRLTMVWFNSQCLAIARVLQRVAYGSVLSKLGTTRSISDRSLGAAGSAATYQWSDAMGEWRKPWAA